MAESLGETRYRRLFEQLGDERARAMLDKLQIVALTSPETMRELEGFLDRKLAGVAPVGRANDPTSGESNEH